VRYWLANKEEREARAQRSDRERQEVKAAALKHKTYGYRRIYLEVNQGLLLGRDSVRRYMSELGLGKHLPKRQRKPAATVSSVRDLPAGRRVQIDATRFSLSDGVAWKYVVQDVASRACLGVRTVRGLSKETAASSLCAAKTMLDQLGITDPLVVQSDAGSDFTSAHFQDTCNALGASWHRCRVNEKGGMGILERCNRTLKWEFVFWEQPTTIAELAALDADFKRWYNRERIHSAIGYQTPWQKLLEDATLPMVLG
jgi:putative transposase